MNFRIPLVQGLVKSFGTVVMTVFASIVILVFSTTVSVVGIWVVITIGGMAVLIGVLYGFGIKGWE